jgi:hypothetical protein
MLRKCRNSYRPERGRVFIGLSPGKAQGLPRRKRVNERYFGSQVISGYRMVVKSQRQDGDEVSRKLVMIFGK